MKESDIQMQIIEFLSFHSRRNNFIFFSIPNEALLMISVKFGIPKTVLFKILTFFKKMGMTPGVADIQIVKSGKAYFLEVKSETGKLSKNQQIFKDNVLRSGAEYRFVRNLDECINILKSWEIIK